MLAAIESVRPIIRRYARVVAYGSSMGGYGACLFSRDIDATDVVALSPQYSIWPDKMPSESRWAHYVPKIRPIFDDMPARMSREARVSIFYDPVPASGGGDEQHAAAYRNLGADTYALPYGGHSVAGFLHSLGMLARLQTEALSPNFDPATIAASINAAAHESLVYQDNLKKAVA